MNICEQDKQKTTKKNTHTQIHATKILCIYNLYSLFICDLKLLFYLVFISFRYKKHAMAMHQHRYELQPIGLVLCVWTLSNSGTKNASTFHNTLQLSYSVEINNIQHKCLCAAGKWKHKVHPANLEAVFLQEY